MRLCCYTCCDVLFALLCCAENRLDVDSLRDRNSELREQVSELNMKVFEMMLASNEKSLRSDPKGSKALPSVAPARTGLLQTVITSTSSKSNTNSSGNNISDDDDDDDDNFEDAVPNVEDAYAINTTKKKNIASNKTERLLDDDAINTSEQDDNAPQQKQQQQQQSSSALLPLLDESPDGDSDGKGDDKGDGDGDSRELRLQEVVDQYEKQFEIMKVGWLVGRWCELCLLTYICLLFTAVFDVMCLLFIVYVSYVIVVCSLPQNEIRYMRMTEKRVYPPRGGGGGGGHHALSMGERERGMREGRGAGPRAGGGGGGQQYVALSETALKVVSGTTEHDKHHLSAGMQGQNQLVNHTVSFASPSSFSSSPNPNIVDGGNTHKGNGLVEQNVEDNNSSSNNSGVVKDGKARTRNDLDGRVGMEDKLSASSVDQHEHIASTDTSSPEGINSSESIAHPLSVPEKPFQQEQPSSSSSNSLHAIAPSLKQRRYIDKMIQRGIDSGKDIDKKTIKSLSEEIELLTQDLKEKEVIIASSSASTTSAASAASTVPGGPPLASTAGVQPAVHTAKVKRETQLHSSSSYQIHLLYSFLLGGMVVLIVSTFMTWIWNYV